MLNILVVLSIMLGSGRDAPPVSDAPSVNEAPKVCCVNCVCLNKCKCKNDGDCLKHSVQKTLNYAEGVYLAKKRSVPLITYVGPNAASVKEVKGYVVCSTKTLEGYKVGDKITSKWVNGQHIMEKVEGPSAVNYATTIVVPNGQHAHVTIDGKTIVHGNENLGNAPAHAGVAIPWYRTGEAGQTIQWCPNGNCPRR